MKDTVFHRSFYSFISNVLKSVLSFATGILIARGLGPEEYGVFAFLLASFTALRSLLDMGTSSAFFSFIAKRNRSRQFVGYYLGWLIVQFLLSFLFIALLAPDEWISSIWEGESRERVVVAFVAVFLQQQLWNSIAVLGESQRYTVRVQVLSILVAVAHLLLVASSYWLDILTLERVYWFIIYEFLLAALIAKQLFPLVFTEEREALKSVVRDYWRYCLPLIPYAWIGMVAGFADTWLLQHYGGAVEQAYYSVAAQFAAISLIATTSVLRILWKEVAEANHQGNHHRVQRLYEKTNRILFTLGALISGFLIPWTSEIITLLLGESYVEGAFVMALMFLYPIHQSLGQVNGTMFYAMELTKPYVIIGMIQMLLATITVYLLVAPENAFVPGLGLASTGLALKMVVLQFIGVNFSIWWLSRLQGWKYGMGYQVVGIVFFVAIGFVVYYSVNILLGDYWHVLLLGGLAGCIYLVLAGAVLYMMPWLIAMEKAELNNYIVKLKDYFSSSHKKSMFNL